MTRRKGPSFEEQMEELSRLVDEIGREDCPLDELEARVGRAATLIGNLRARLSATEMSVRDILKDLASSRQGVRPAGAAQDGAVAPADDEDESDRDEEDEDDEDDPEDGKAR